MLRAVTTILLIFQVIIFFSLFHPSRCRVWGWSPFLDTAFVQQSIQHGFHAFPHLVFPATIQFGFWFLSFVVAWSVVVIFIFIILSRHLGMLVQDSPGNYHEFPYDSDSLWDPRFPLLHLGAVTHQTGLVQWTWKITSISNDPDAKDEHDGASS